MSLYDLLLTLNNQNKAPVISGRQLASPHQRAVIQTLNDHIGKELETAEIAKLSGLQRETTLKILERLKRDFNISSKLSNSLNKENKIGINAKTIVKKWINHSRIVMRA